MTLTRTLHMHKVVFAPSDARKSSQCCHFFRGKQLPVVKSNQRKKIGLRSMPVTGTREGCFRCEGRGAGFCLLLPPPRRTTVSPHFCTHLSPLSFGGLAPHCFRRVGRGHLFHISPPARTAHDGPRREGCSGGEGPPKGPTKGPSEATSAGLAHEGAIEESCGRRPYGKSVFQVLY